MRTAIQLLFDIDTGNGKDASITFRCFSCHARRPHYDYSTTFQNTAPGSSVDYPIVIRDE